MKFFIAVLLIGAHQSTALPVLSGHDLLAAMLGTTEDVQFAPVAPVRVPTTRAPTTATPTNAPTPSPTTSTTVFPSAVPSVYTDGWDPTVFPYPTQPTFSGLTAAQVAAIKADITALVPFDQVGRTSTCSRSGQGCTDFLAGLVQLAFHDAGTYDKTTGTGGPDGCIDLNIDENKGLKWITSVIAPVFRKHSSVISYADFVVLAANTAIYVASGNAVTLPFNWGRTNGDDCAIADHDKLPQAKKSLSHTQDVFVTRMGLTLQDITALMGAHTIGRAEDANSGYSGAWDTTSAVWDNRYYSEMVGRPWVREVRWVNGNQHFDWREPNTQTLMLNTDMSLAFEIGDPDPNNGANTCRVGGGNSCARQTAGSNALVDSYIADQSKWFADFSVAWQKLTELKWEGKLAAPGQARPGALATPTPTATPTTATNPPTRAPTVSRRG